KGIRKRATRDIRKSVTGRRRRDSVMTCISQITDIVFGSIQLGDVPVSINGVEALSRFVADDYLRVKKKLRPEWFHVGHSAPHGADIRVVDDERVPATGHRRARVAS